MLKRKKQIIAKVMATTMLASTLALTFTTTNVSAAQTKSTVSTTKISGDDRYETAVEISKKLKIVFSSHAIIVNGQKGIVDALTATPYASLKNAPILMTQNNKLNADTKSELKRLRVDTVDIIGGTASISNNVKSEIEKMGIKVNRIAGNSKYETALRVAKEIEKISDITKIAVANGEVLADAVSVAAPAAQNKMPIILAHTKKGLDQSTKEFIDDQDISKSYIIGGSDAVSNTTENRLPGTTERLEGINRQDTNASVIEEFYTNKYLDNIYIAKSGQVDKTDEISDALAVGVLAAKNEDPVMLVGKSLANSQRDLLEDKRFIGITEIGDGISSSTIRDIKDTQDSDNIINITRNVYTVTELEDALDDAKDRDTINFDPYKIIFEDIDLSTTKDVTINLEGKQAGDVTVNMENGILNINEDITGNVYVRNIKKINISRNVTVTRLQIKSTAEDAIIVNKGRVKTLDVSAAGVEISGSGDIDTLNKRNDTDISGVTGNIGNEDNNNKENDDVSEVTVLNSKEMLVKFNTSIDNIPTINIIGGIFDTKIRNPKLALSENRRSMTITAEQGKYFEGSYLLELYDMKSNGKALDTYRKIINVEDNIAPTVTSVAYNQENTKIEISLSEPIDSTRSILLKTGMTILTPDPTTTPTKKIAFKITKDIPLNTDVAISIEGLKDSAGNKTNSYNVTIRTKSDELPSVILEK